MNRTNTDEIFIRNITISLLEILSTELYINQVVNDKPEDHRVKFMVSAGNSEQFMKDFFLGVPDNLCVNVHKAEGNYETLPFGIIMVPPKIQINTKDLTNKFVRAKYTKKEFDENENIHGVGYNSRLLALPMSLTFNIEIRVAQINHLMKVLESVIDTFFQTRVSYTVFKGQRITMITKFPEQVDTEKLSQFDFSTVESHSSVKFSVVVDTTYPSYDKSSTLKSDNVIERFNIATTQLNTGRVIGNKSGDFIDETVLTD